MFTEDCIRMRSDVRPADVERVVVTCGHAHPKTINFPMEASGAPITLTFTVPAPAYLYKGTQAQTQAQAGASKSRAYEYDISLPDLGARPRDRGADDHAGPTGTGTGTDAELEAKLVDPKLALLKALEDEVGRIELSFLSKTHYAGRNAFFLAGRAHVLPVDLVRQTNDVQLAVLDAALEAVGTCRVRTCLVLPLPHDVQRQSLLPASYWRQSRLIGHRGSGAQGNSKYGAYHHVHIRENTVLSMNAASGM